MMFRFAYPVLLVLLVGAVGYLVFQVLKKPIAVTHSMTSRLVELADSGSRIWLHIPLVIRVLCLVLLVLAAARPQFYNVSRDIRSPGVDIVMSIDTSGSMRALDFELDGEPVTRLTAVKKVVSDFVKKREVDRIGLVVFGEEAFTQAPLTLDKGLLLGLVDKLTIGMAGDRTAVGAAIAIGGKRLKDLKAATKILILLTDGRHNAGELTPEEAAEAVQALGVKIYTIGVGGKGPAPFRVKSLIGTRIVRRKVDLDETTLKKIARIGGGKYFRATDTKGLAEIYDIIDQAEKTEIKVKEFFHFRELYPYFLIPALILLGLEIVLKSTVLRTVP